jgi:hypothetical protein
MTQEEYDNTCETQGCNEPTKETVNEIRYCFYHLAKRNSTDYRCWGTSELIEKCENAELFAKEIAEYWEDKGILNDVEIYLLEKARKLAGMK